MLDRLCDQFFGRAGVRRIPTQEKVCFLTFDDGPHTIWTPLVLDVLDQYDAKATFFVVGKKAQQNRPLIDRILQSGHALGNHSLDHQYRVFFESQEKVDSWVLQSQLLMDEIAYGKSVGFRSPNGIHTPPLARALQKHALPLFLWDTRFFDGVYPFRFNKKICDKIRPGSIVLLHDSQRFGKPERFQEELEKLLNYLKNQDWKFQTLPLSSQPSS